MDNIENQRLREALIRNANQLEKFLADPERDSHDLHYIIAGQLRLLLCDKDLPILLYFANESRVPLVIWGPYPPNHIFSKTKKIFTFDALVASFHEVEFSYCMTIEEYLDTEIGSIPDNINKINITYTPRKLIKWLSNKEGVSHLELKPIRSLEAIKSAIEIEGQLADFSQADNIILRNSIIQIAEWTLEAIRFVLAHK